MPQLSAEDEEALASAPQPGSVFAEKYVIDKVLGIGGMGYVLSARHAQLDEMVAIKMLLPRLTRDSEMVGRFMREGRAAVKIQSEHVARIRDVGSFDGTPYIVMEYLSGTDLAGLLRREARLETTRAVDYLLQACEAIAEAHALNIVHRDLKPANLFLARRANGPECIKVLDFGISKMTGPHGSPEMSMTRTSSVLGSPLYMSPEQLTSAKHVDSRTDIWSLGVILFELVAGRVPFLADSLPELGVMVLTGRARMRRRRRMQRRRRMRRPGRGRAVEHLAIPHKLPFHDRHVGRKETARAGEEWEDRRHLQAHRVDPGE